MARGFQQFAFDAEVPAEIEDLRGAAETLRAKFEEEAVAALGTNYTAGTRGDFDKLGVQARFAQVVGASQPGDSGADDEDWDVSGHEARKPSYHLETVRLERVTHPPPPVFSVRVPDKGLTLDAARKSDKCRG
jgi:hypothetical protein